jgi:hypothetical protein
MPRVEFEPTIPAFERTMRIYALNQAAAVIDEIMYHLRKYNAATVEYEVIQCEAALMRRNLHIMSSYTP